MPDADLCRQIAETVRNREQLYPRLIFITEGTRQRESLEAYFLRVLRPALRQNHPEVNEIVRETVGLMAYLSPSDHASPYDMAPPVPLCNELIDHLLAYIQDIPADSAQIEPAKLIVQITLAYGCMWLRSAWAHPGPSGAAWPAGSAVTRRLDRWDGLGRSRRRVTGGSAVTRRLDRWDGVWPAARKELTDTAYNFVLQTIHIMGLTIRDFDVNADEEGDVKIDDRTYKFKIIEYAETIVARFLNPVYALIHQKSQQHRTIHTWDPLKGNLYGWLKRAVRGGGNQHGRLQANWLATGRLFDLLQDEEALITGKAAFQVCGTSGKASEYDGTDCPDGHGPMILFAKTLSLVPGVYVTRPFWHHEGHYYEYHLQACPHCGTPRPQRESYLWVQAKFALAVPLDPDLQRIIEQEVNGYDTGD